MMAPDKANRVQPDELLSMVGWSGHIVSVFSLLPQDLMTLLLFASPPKL